MRRPISCCGTRLLPLSRAKLRQQPCSAQATLPSRSTLIPCMAVARRLSRRMLQTPHRAAGGASLIPTALRLCLERRLDPTHGRSTAAFPTAGFSPMSGQPSVMLAVFYGKSVRQHRHHRHHRHHHHRHHQNRPCSLLPRCPSRSNHSEPSGILEPRRPQTLAAPSRAGMR